MKRNKVRRGTKCTRGRFMSGRGAAVVTGRLGRTRPAIEAMEARLLLAVTPIVRVNAGGPSLSGTPTWMADTSGSPSTYVNASATGNVTYTTASSISMSDPSVPAGTPAAVFQSHRFDLAGGSEMQWAIPVTAGQYTVRLYFAETYSGNFAVGKRQFDVAIEGAQVLNNYDIYADVGGNKGVVKTFTVNSDSTLNINFAHVVENPLVSGIEILSGSGVTPVGFGKSTLTGTGLTNPTSLQWGPDNKLYVAQQDGTIKVFSVTRNSANSYALTGTQTINLIKNIPNHNDDGTLNSAVTTRQVTGLYVAGTAANPVVFVTSSDPRIGGGSAGTDTGLDTNSGILSKLTWNGASWVKQDLVRGLPRSEENHSSNGMAYDAASNTLYIAQGGNTNMGAPSNNFAYLTEYALSAAILSVNLTAIGSGTYDLPTLDDETRANSGPGGADLNDPFGGDNGRNQAKLVPGGPVQIYSSGYRNAYDVIIAASGKMYTIDNGANAGWGDVPIGSGANVTNQVHEPGVTTKDNLHVVTAGFYAGHPNPTRANPNNTFNGSNPQSPVTTGDAAEGYFLTPGVNDGALSLYDASTNGLVEYTASNFGGAMKGNLLAASFDNKVYRVQLTSAGTGVTSNTSLFGSVGVTPLDVTAVGDNGLFPGTIWVADHQANAIFVFEPNDYGGSGGGGGTGADDPNLDDDHDTYNNHDEILNGTNPLSAADVPPDWDYNPNSLTNDSNLIDPDDDNDTQPDTSDPFAIDKNNGRGTAIPLSYTWDNNVAKPGGILDLGFTGLMTNGSANYEALYSAASVTAGGAAGVFTIDQIGEGTARGSTNTQTQGYQFGINVNQSSAPFVIHTRILSPFAGLVPQAGQEMGVYFGTGDQDNYAELAVTASGVAFMKEIGGTVTDGATASIVWPGPSAIDLYLTVNPSAGTIQPAYTTTAGGVTSAMTALGGLQSIPVAWFTGAAGPAVGLIGTSAGPAPEFPVTYDLIEVTTTPGSQAPYGGTPLAFPGTLQAENFDTGGEGVAYHDLDVANQGGAFRVSEGVDLQTTTDAGGGYNVGWAQAGEWLEYTVTVPTSGDYTLGLRVASAGAGGTMHVEVDGVNKTGSITIPNTGGWQTWTTLSKTINVSAGQHVLRVAFDANGGTGYVGNLNWLQLSGPITNTQTPFKGTPFNAGDTIQVEDFDNGGEGVAFHDTDTVNSGGAYRSTGVDIQGTGDTGGGYNVGWTKAGEWLEYTVNVAAAGNYNITVRVANPNTGGKFHIEFGGVNKTGTISVPVTGAWQTYQTITIPNVALSAGQQVMRIAFDTNSSNNNVGNFNWVQFSAAAPVAAWSTAAAVPTALGEVAGGIINGKLYLVGEGSSSTFVYTIASNSWSTVATRPFVGNHHAAEVINNKLYLFGGLGGSSEGKVQIYDPATNAWTAGANMPWSAGSISTALIGGKVYAAGGILTNSTTTNQAGVYDPATNGWSAMASMPQGRNHAAATTDGAKFYVIGGRTGGNVVSNGFGTVQIYTPGTNSWVSSDTAGSTIAPLPIGRGGMGKAVFYNGEIYVMGGETSTGPGATAQKVYNRVDIYSPTANTWRLGPSMPTARHGIFPLLSGTKIYVAGGGTQAGGSQSTVDEVLSL